MLTFNVTLAMGHDMVPLYRSRRRLPRVTNPEQPPPPVIGMVTTGTGPSLGQESISQLSVDFMSRSERATCTKDTLR